MSCLVFSVVAFDILISLLKFVAFLSVWVAFGMCMFACSYMSTFLRVILGCMCICKSEIYTIHVHPHSTGSL